MNNAKSEGPELIAPAWLFPCHSLSKPRAYLLFQFLGKSWIENKLAQRLEQHQHQQALELQRLRVETTPCSVERSKCRIASFRFFQKHGKNSTKHGLATWLTSPFQQYPAVGRMANDELEEFLSTAELLESQKTQDIIFWHRLHKVKKAVAELQTCVARNGIFLPVALKEQYLKVIPICGLSSRQR